MDNKKIITREISTFDPYDVKKSLVDLADSYFGVENLDTYESGFMGYYIQALTHLTSDMLFQNAMAYNEAFLNKAILPSSVYNIATQLDYEISTATPASGKFNAIILLPQDDLVTKISSGSKLQAGSIPYRVINNYYITKNNKGISISSQNPETGVVEEVPYTIERYNSNMALVINLDVRQVESYFHELIFEDPTLYIFYEEILTGFDGDIIKINVSIEGEKYNKVSSIYTAGNSDRVYEPFIHNKDSKLTLKFGNGVYGYLPKNGAKGYVRLQTTLGTKGNIIKDVLQFTERLINVYDGSALQIYGSNRFAITNGKDGEEFNEIKRHVVENISSAKRLVTEKDYKGFQGITGLTSLKAFPILTRNDIVGNQIPFYIVKYQENNVPVPAASIPLKLDPSEMELPRGTAVEHEDVSYRIPFKLKVDDTYDFKVGRYIYELNNITVTPKLFIDYSKPDVLIGMRQLQIRPYIHDDTIVFIAECYKLSNILDHYITADITLYQSDPVSNSLVEVAGPYNLEYSKSYGDNSTIILSTTTEDDSNIPFGSCVGIVNLYYNGELYNDYKFLLDIYSDSEPSMLTSGTNKYYKSSSSNSDSFLHFENFEVNNWNHGLQFEFTFFKTVSVDLNGDPINYTRINPVFHMFNKYKTLSYLRENIQENTYTFGCVFDYDEMENGPHNWDLTVTYVDDLYNIYNGVGTIMTIGRRAISEQINQDPYLYGTPRLYPIHIGLNNIEIEHIQDSDAYKFIIQVSKMSFNEVGKIAAQLTLGSYVINFETKYSTPEDIIVLETGNIPSTYFQEGQVDFKIQLSYDTERHAIYKQSAIFKYDITSIVSSNVVEDIDGKTWVYAVPVIEKDFYDNNIKFIDQSILSEIAQFRYKFIDTKMLTDQINIKFARTFGKSINMRYNIFNAIISKEYDPEFSIELPPKLDLTVYVKKTVKSSVQDIINECKNVLYTFLTLKTDYHKNIYRSEISRFLHDTVDEVEFCEVNEPTTDIIYDFNLDHIPKPLKHELRIFCPEYIWIDKEKINITIAFIG